MKNLTTLFLTAILGIASLSCNGQSASANKKNAKQSKAQITKPIKLNKADFLKKIMNYETNSDEWIYLGDKPAIIDFYTDWCPPCRKIAPILDELAEEYSGKIYIYKINTEEERELAAVFGIKTIPFLLFIPMNETPHAFTGAMSKADFKKVIDELLLK